MCSGHHPMVSRPHATNDATYVGDVRNNKAEPITKCTSNDPNAYHPEFVHDKINEIRISISRTNKIKMQNPSHLSQMLGGLIGWGQKTRNIGYYSPPMEHPIDKISIRLDACANDSKDDVGHSLVANNHSKSKGHVEFATESIQYSDDDHHDGGGDADFISNSSLKDCNAIALEDELSTYMNELRLRELR